MMGSRISLLVGLIASALILIIGSAYGAVAGFFGGWADLIMMRIVDIIYTLPDILMKALNDVSLNVRQGEVLGIVGESGSGKSVTAYSLIGLTAHPGRLLGGELIFNGRRINDMTERELRKIRGNEISIIFQDPMTSLNPVYTIGRQIREVILLHTGKNKREANERARELLRLVGINEPDKRLKQYPHELSGRMRQRVMIAIALACEPKLLIADEPTTALDVTIQAQILELMDMLNPPAGCPFAPRCRSCMKICLKRMPDYTDLGNDHYSACWLLDKTKYEQEGAARA